MRGRSVAEVIAPTHYPAVALGPRRRFTWAGLRRRTATTAAVTACVFSSVLAVAIASASHTEAGTGVPVLIGVGFVLNLAAAVALVWRHRRPWLVWGLGVAAPVVGDTDALAVLVALVAVLRVASPVRAVGAVASSWVAVVVSFSWDAARSDGNSVLLIWREVPAPGAPDYDVAAWVPLPVATVLVGATAALGLLLRTRSALTEAVDGRDLATAQQRSLREEVVRSEERARIARDMHDALANRLSRISLLAGGLQVGTADVVPDPSAERVRERAELIHGTAHEALDELKTIVGVMRGSPAVPPPPGVEAVAGLVQGARLAGVHVVLTLDLAPARLAPRTSHVVYRMVQEGVTNLQKHAPAETGRVLVSGTPATGVWVQVRNRVPPRVARTAPGPPAGLLGLTEQVAVVGGQVGGGVEGADFVLRGWVPWSG